MLVGSSIGKKRNGAASVNVDRVASVGENAFLLIVVVVFYSVFGLGLWKAAELVLK